MAMVVSIIEQGEGEQTRQPTTEPAECANRGRLDRMAQVFLSMDNHTITTVQVEYHHEQESDARHEAMAPKHIIFP